MALESLAVSKQIQRPAIVKLPIGLGVSDPPFCFPGVSWDCWIAPLQTTFSSQEASRRAEKQIGSYFKEKYNPFKTIPCGYLN
jgi:hypothetical protein